MSEVIISIGAFKIKDVNEYLAKGFEVIAYEPRKDVYEEYLKINNKRFFPFNYAVVGNGIEDEAILKIIRYKRLTEEQGLEQFVNSSILCGEKINSEMDSSLEIVDEYPVNKISAISILKKYDKIKELFIDCEGSEISIILNTPVVLFQKCERIKVQFHLAPEIANFRYAYLNLLRADKKDCINKLSRYFVVENYFHNSVDYLFIRKVKKEGKENERVV